VIRAIEASLQRIEIDLQRRGLAEHDGVVTKPSSSLPQIVPSGNTAKKVAISLCHHAAVGFVERDPLGDEPAGIQPRAAELEVFLRVEDRGAFDPRGGSDRTVITSNFS